MRTLKFACLAALSAIALASAAFAQNANPSSGGNIAVPAGTFGSRELMTVVILIFGIVIVMIEYLLLKGRKTDKLDDLGKYLVITVIVVGTLALMVSSIDNNQTAPAVGLFGTIAGYLLGRSERSHGAPQTAEPDTAETVSTPPARESTPDARRAA